MPETFFTPAAGDKLQIGDIILRPAYNPAILETCLWNGDKICSLISNNRGSFKSLLSKILKESKNTKSRPEKIKEGPFIAFPPSILRRQKTVFGLIQFEDGQIALLAVSESGQTFRPESLRGLDVFFKCRYNSNEKEKYSACLIKSNLKSVRRFLNYIAPEMAPRALGGVPKLGIGNRMTVLAWPGIFKALQKGKLPANAIQNSVGRELAPLTALINLNGVEHTYLPGLGRVPTGHTGSSISGLWLYGVLSAMMAGHTIPYGADADHIPVKRDGGRIKIKQAGELIDQSKDYTFFTLDTSDLFNYRNSRVPYPGFENGHSFAPGYAKTFIFKNPGKGRDFRYLFSADEFGRYGLKYGLSLGAAGELYQHLKTLKGETKFDFEFSMDEHPDNISTQEAVTSPKELIFVINELRFRGVNVNHIAPNFGVEKGVDYRLSDGIGGLKGRITEMSAIAEEMGVLLDFHSGDDLSRRTCRAIAGATGGRLQLKVSPKLQMIFAETLFDYDRELFNRWWDWTLAYAQKEAAAGSVAAKKSTEKLKGRLKNNPSPSPQDDFFHSYSFAIIGLKNKKGCYRFREKFYKATEKVKEEYGGRITDYILNLAKILEIL